LPAIVNKALASSRLRFSGERTLEFAGKNLRRSHVEIVVHDGDRTRVEFPAGTPLAGQIIVEDAAQRQQYLPRRNEIEVLPPRNDVTMVRLGNLFKRAVNQGWTIGTGTGILVAGIQTDETFLRDPKGVTRQRMWIDPETGMILKRIVYTPNGDFQAGFEYTKIEFNPRLWAGVFAINHPGARLVTPDMRAKALAAKNGFTRVAPPSGSEYKLENSRMVNLPSQQALLEVYSGPSGRLSLFHLRSMIDPLKLQQFSQGRFHVYTWQRNGETLALVGDIDERRLEEVAKQFGG
jgi:outer membrane lipoprotein-sorting protein